MSVADDAVEPRWLKGPKWASATANGQRSAAQNGQDSSLTKTIAGLPPMVSGGPAALTVCSGVAAWPGLTRVSATGGTVVTCLTTAVDASDSLAVAADAGPELSLTATSTPKIARTAVTAAIGTRNRRRASARF